VFGISTVEFVVIAVVALMLFSPKELPAIIRSFTKFWGSLRATADDFRDAIMNEEELDEIKKAIKGGKDELKKAETAARRELMKARMEMQKAQNKLIKTVKASEQAQKDAIAAAAPETETPAADAATNGPPPAPAEGAPSAASEPPAAPAAAPEPMGPSGTVPADGKVDQGAA
jgi:Sec-independent protein translocase protein TatA